MVADECADTIIVGRLTTQENIKHGIPTIHVVRIIKRNFKTWKIYKELNMTSHLYVLTRARGTNFLVINSLVNE